MQISVIRIIWERTRHQLGCYLFLSVIVAGFATSVFAENITHATKSLFDSVWRGDLVGVKSSIMSGADISAVNELGSRPVDMAVDRGHFEIAHYLLSIDQQRSEANAASALPDLQGGPIAVRTPRSAPVASDSEPGLLFDNSPSASIASSSKPIPVPATLPQLAVKLPTSSSPAQEKLWSPDDGSSTKESSLQVLSTAKPQPSVSSALAPTNAASLKKYEVAETPTDSVSENGKSTRSVGTTERAEPVKKGWLDRVTGLFQSSEEGASSLTSELNTERKAEIADLEKRKEPSAVTVSETVTVVERPSDVSFEVKTRDETSSTVRGEKISHKVQDISQSSEVASSQAMLSPAEVTSVDATKKPEGGKFFSRIAKLFGAPENDTDISTKSEVVGASEINKLPTPLIDSGKQAISELEVLSESKSNPSVLNVTPITEEASLGVDEVRPALEGADLIRNMPPAHETTVKALIVDSGSKSSSNEVEGLDNEKRKVQAGKRLFAAVRADDLVGVKSSIMSGADISAVNELGSRPVDMAVDRGHFEIAHYLLSIDQQRSEANAASALPDLQGGPIAVRTPRSAPVASDSEPGLLFDNSPSASIASSSKPIPVPATLPQLAVKLPTSSSPAQEKLWSPDDGSSTKESSLQVLSTAKPQPSVSSALAPTNAASLKKYEVAETPTDSVSENGKSTRSVGTTERAEPVKKGWLDRVTGLFQSSEEGASSLTSELNTERKAEIADLEKRKEPSAVTVSETVTVVERPSDVSFEVKTRDETSSTVRGEKISHKVQDISQSSEVASSQAMLSPAEVTSVDATKKPEGGKFFSRIAKLFGAPENDTDISTKSEVVGASEINKLPTPLIDSGKQAISELEVLSESKSNPSVLNVTPITEEASLGVDEVRPALEGADLIRNMPPAHETTVKALIVDSGSKSSSNEVEGLARLGDNREMLTSEVVLNVPEKLTTSAVAQNPSSQAPEPVVVPPDELKVKRMYSGPENSVPIARVNPENSRFDPRAKGTFWRPDYESNKTMFKQNTSIVLSSDDMDIPAKSIAAEAPEENVSPAPLSDTLQLVGPRVDSGSSVGPNTPVLDVPAIIEEAAEAILKTNDVKPELDTKPNILSRLANLYTPVLEVRSITEEASLRTDEVKPVTKVMDAIGGISSVPETSVPDVRVDSGSKLKRNQSGRLARGQDNLEFLPSDRNIPGIDKVQSPDLVEKQTPVDVGSPRDKIGSSSIEEGFKKVTSSAPENIEAPNSAPRGAPHLWSPHGASKAKVPSLRIIKAPKSQPTKAPAFSGGELDIPTETVTPENPEALEKAAKLADMRTGEVRSPYLIPDTNLPQDYTRPLKKELGSKATLTDDLTLEDPLVPARSLVAEIPEANQFPVNSAISQTTILPEPNLSATKDSLLPLKAKSKKDVATAKVSAEGSLESISPGKSQSASELASLPRVSKRPRRKRVSLPKSISMGANAARVPVPVNAGPPLNDKPLWLTERRSLGQPLLSQNDVSCIDKRQWNTVYCIEPMRWPAKLMPAFKVISKFYRGHNAIIEYVAGRSAQIHVLFRTGELRRISEYFTQRFGSPTERGEILTALIGQPKRSNRTLRWRSIDSKTKRETVLEIREIDDLRWSAPPDIKHGVLRLYSGKRGSVFEFLTSTDLLMVKLRSRP